MSCSKDPDETDKPNKPDDHNIIEWGDSTLSGDATMGEMKFNVVNGMSVVRHSTRGTNNVDGDEYTFAENEKVKLAVSSDYRDSEEIKEYKITNTTTGALGYAGTPSTDGLFWKNKSEEVALRAWGRSNATSAGDDPVGAEFELTENQTSGYNELLYFATATDYDYETYKDNIEINLEHMLARVVINVSFDSGSTLDEIKIGDGTMTLPTTATFDPSNAKKWTGFGSQTAVITPKTEAENSCYSAVLIPTTYAAGTKLFVITIGSETFAYKLDADLEMEAGKQYNYTVKIKNKKIEVSSEIHPWGTTVSPSNIASSGVIQYPLALEYLATGNIKSHNKNAQGQWVIDEENEVNSSAYFNWDTASGYFSSRSVECSDGKKYHWGSWKEWKALIPSIPNPSSSVDKLINWAGSKTETDISIGGRTGLTFSSYWVKVSNSLMLAIRYISSTNIGYCSAWRYEINSTNLVIKAKRLNIPITNLSQASNESGPLWALVKSDSFWASDVISRTLPYCRLYTGGDGEAGSQDYSENMGLYLCAERYNATYYYEVGTSSSYGVVIWSSDYGVPTAGRSVRLFKDIID